MLEIGINHGLRLAPSKMSDNGEYFELMLSRGKTTASVVELLESEEEPETNKLAIFPPKVVNKKEEKRDHMQISSDLRTVYQYFYQMFLLYFTKEELKTTFPASIIHEGLTITLENQAAIMTSQPSVDKMFNNICKAAIKFIAESGVTEMEPFRIKLPRQSDDKAFPRLVYKPSFGGWIELESVPLEKSTVKFSDWEIAQGHANAAPKAADKVAAPPKGKKNAFEESAEGNTEADQLPFETSKDELPWEK